MKEMDFNVTKVLKMPDRERLRFVQTLPNPVPIKEQWKLTGLGATEIVRTPSPEKTAIIMELLKRGARPTEIIRPGLDTTFLWDDPEVFYTLFRHRVSPIDVSKLPGDIDLEMLKYAARRGIRFDHEALMDAIRAARVDVVHFFLKGRLRLKPTARMIRYAENSIQRTTKNAIKQSRYRQIVDLLAKANKTLVPPKARLLAHPIRRVPPLCKRVTFQILPTSSKTTAAMMDLNRAASHMATCLYMEDIYEYFMDSHCSYVFLARDESTSKYIAAAACTMETNYMFLDFLCSSKACRGAGSKLVHFMEDFARTQNMSYIILGSDLTATGFYDKLGYTRFDHTENTTYTNTQSIAQRTRSRWTGYYMKQLKKL